MHVIETTLSGIKRQPSSRGKKNIVELTPNKPVVTTGSPLVPDTPVAPITLSDGHVSVSKISPEKRVGAIVALKGGAPVGIIVSQESEHSRVKVWGSCGRTKNYQFNELVIVDPDSSTYLEFLRALEEEEVNHQTHVALKALADDKAGKDEDYIRTEQLKKFKRWS